MKKNIPQSTENKRNTVKRNLEVQMPIIKSEGTYDISAIKLPKQDLNQLRSQLWLGNISQDLIIR